MGGAGQRLGAAAAQRQRQARASTGHQSEGLGGLGDVAAHAAICFEANTCGCSEGDSPILYAPHYDGWLPTQVGRLLGFAATPELLACASAGGELTLLDTTSLELLARLACPNVPSDLALSPAAVGCVLEGTRLTALHSNGALCSWDCSKTAEVCRDCCIFCACSQGGSTLPQVAWANVASCVRIS